MPQKDRKPVKNKKTGNPQYKINNSARRSLKRKTDPDLPVSELRKMAEYKMMPAIELMDEFVAMSTPIMAKLQEILGINYVPNSKDEAYRTKSTIGRVIDEYYDSMKDVQFLDDLQDSGYDEYPYKKKEENGYIMLYDAGLKFFRAEHRHVMELHLRRRLETKEMIHHIDCVKDNNSLENLMIVNAAEHKKIHKEIREEEQKGLRFSK